MLGFVTRYPIVPSAGHGGPQSSFFIHAGTVLHPFHQMALTSSWLRLWKWIACLASAKKTAGERCEKRASGCLGDLLGMKNYPLIWVYMKTRCGFKLSLTFTPIHGEMIPIWWACFSNGLKPPTCFSGALFAKFRCNMCREDDDERGIMATYLEPPNWW